MNTEGKVEEEEISEEEKEEPKVEKEKSPETPQFDLDKTRADYVGAYTEYKKAFGGMKGKDLKDFQKTIESARKYIEIGDSERLKDPTEIEAELRKQNFISALEEKGILFGRANAIYETELKKAEYDKTKEELGKKLAEQGVGKAEIFQKLILDERELLNQAKIESWPPKEKNIFRKGMEWWMKRGTATRLLISTGLVTGVVAGVGGFGAAAVATYAGYRFVRGFGSVMIAKLAGKGVDMAMSRGIEAKKESAMEKLKTGFDLEKLTETEKGLEKIFEETAKRERRKLLIKAAVSATAGAGAAIGIGMLEQAWAGGGVKVAPETLKPKTSTPEKMPAEIVPEAPPKSGIPITPEEIKPKISTEAAPKIEPEYTEIGERGPEGAIIDSFRADPDLAEKFGWKGAGGWGDPEFEKWAGIKANQLWLEDAKESLAKPETLEQLKKLGYSADAEGYAKMMHRIGKGAVELDPQTGKINLMDTEYLKAKTSLEDAITGKTAPAEMPPETSPQFVEATPVRPVGATTAESSWAEAGKKVEYVDESFPKVKPTEQIFSEVSPAIGRQIITEKLHDYFGMWSGTYDKFSGTKLKDFFELNSASGYRVTGAPWEDYDYNKFSGLQTKMEKVSNALDATEKGGAAGKSVETFIKKYFIKIFEGK